VRMICPPPSPKEPSIEIIFPSDSSPVVVYTDPSLVRRRIYQHSLLTDLTSRRTVSNASSKAVEPGAADIVVPAAARSSV
jgi:hypothetical protein